MSLIKTLWQSGGVNRWHHNDDHRLRNSQDTNWAHQYRVALLMMRLFPTCTKADIAAAMFHDAPEKKTGDVGRETKLESGDLRALLQRDETKWHVDHDTPTSNGDRRIKLCDSLDAYLWMLAIAPDLQHDADWCAHRMEIEQSAVDLGVGAAVMEMTDAG